MKLDRLVSGACAAVAVASLFACGSGSSASRAAKTAAEQAALDERIATTELMSAQLAGPAPKVGKSHLVVDEEETTEAAGDELGAPKEARRSDGSRRGGHFGTTK